MNPPNVLWLSVSPYLKCLDQRLLCRLTTAATVRRWEYCQTIDEPCCIQLMVNALHEYVSDRSALEKSFGNPSSKIHLAGHGVSGIVALLYAQAHPEQVASLTLLSVAAQPASNWQAHYYALRQLLPCSREMILAQMTRLLFGPQTARFTKALSGLLASDLDSSLTLHSLAHRTQITPGQTQVPLLVCNGELDAIAGDINDANWQKWQIERSLAPSSDTDISSVSTDEPGAIAHPSFRLWHCPKGNHFFHFYHSATVAETISAHWRASALAATTPQKPFSSATKHPTGHRITQLA